MTSLVLTLIGPDRPGLVELLAATLTRHHSNWLESRMAHLAGQFAGILLVEVPDADAKDLMTSLHELEAQGLRVVAARSSTGDIEDPERALVLELVGTDRPGIIREVSQALAARGVNVDRLDTGCSTAPMSGETLFRASAHLRAPANLEIAELRSDLEKISTDLMVDIDLADAP